MTTIAIRHLVLGGLTFRVRISGPDDGDLVVLLHGFPQSAVEWDAQLDALSSAGFRAVAVDQRGYSPGARPERVEEYQTGRLVADVLAVADHLGADTFHLVGHDWGGFVAWAVAWHHPNRLRTLTAVSVPHPAAYDDAYLSDDDQRRRSSYLRWFREDHLAEEALLGDGGAGLRAAFEGVVAHEAVEAYVRQHIEPGALTAALNWYRAMQPGFVGRLGPIAVPTLYVWSDHDVALGRVAAEATSQHVNAPYRFETLVGVTHWIPEQAPDALNRLLLEHVTTPRPRPEVVVG